MARLKLKTVSPPTTRSMVHDRRSTDSAIVGRTDIGTITVDDPLGTIAGEKIIVLCSERDDPLLAMRNAKQLDEAQYIAGRHWQGAYERSEQGGVKGHDFSRDYVDGGRFYDGVSDSRSKALADLLKATKVLGMEGESIVRDVLAFHMTIRLAAAKRGFVSDPERKYIGRRFRECLDTLAVAFGYAQGVD